MKYISAIRSGTYRKYVNPMLAILFLAASAGSEAATVLLRRPIPLLPEAAARLNQVHADRDLRMWQLVVFGFAHCKDVCPASLANLSMLVKAGVAERISLGGIFVTIDPDRDTDAILSQYIRAFGTDLGYLRLEGGELERFKAAFSVETAFYTKNAGNMLNYQVDHSTTAFLIDPAGNIRVIFDALTDATDIEDLFRKNRTLFES
ncbi:protein SCO1/2 [Nitrosospira multiformis]|uniref:Protein SCO1/2 n=1 Tax=Nitrosospira multiformis TaxID=1231 RepID=A0A2T5IEM3_9PROT|nr:SCO family protein [Nitrosospira multiformis]PTQ82259.1 protein SCO1/2 [Nitrosospira multiformis]